MSTYRFNSLDPRACIYKQPPDGVADRPPKRANDDFKKYYSIERLRCRRQQMYTIFFVTTASTAARARTTLDDVAVARSMSVVALGSDRERDERLTSAMRASATVIICVQNERDSNRSRERAFLTSYYDCTRTRCSQSAGIA